MTGWRPCIGECVEMSDGSRHIVTEVNVEGRLAWILPPPARGGWTVDFSELKPLEDSNGTEQHSAGHGPDRGSGGE